MLSQLQPPDRFSGSNGILCPAQDPGFVQPDPLSAGAGSGLGIIRRVQMPSTADSETTMNIKTKMNSTQMGAVRH